MKIQVLGPGCARCAQTEKIVRDAVASAGIEAEVVKISDIMEMMKLGVMSTPAVIIDGKTVCSGRVPTTAQVLEWISGSGSADTTQCGCGCSR